MRSPGGWRTQPADPISVSAVGSYSCGSSPVVRHGAIRCWQDNDGNKRQTVEIQVTPRKTGPPVRYRRGSQVHRRGLSSASDGPSAASSILALSRD
jgi:hypothetical protein